METAVRAVVVTGYEDSWHYVRPDAVRALYNREYRRRLSWYYRVLSGEMPPKFKIVRSIDIGLKLEELASLSLEELWKIHKRFSSDFRSYWKELREGGVDVRSLNVPRNASFLDLKIELVKRITSPCILCERRCMVERAKGKIGACRLSWDVYVHSAFLHVGEESPLVPSGTIFYGGCNFTCVFCQNYDVSQHYARKGFSVTPRSLAAIQDILAAKGARNINHVGGDPTPSLHVIVESLAYVKSDIPQLWNSNMYMSIEAMEILVDLIDIWLPDFKYGNNKCARRLSVISNYVETVTRNLKLAADNGDMIIRHLVMPSHIECCTKPVLKWIYNNLDRDRIIVNVMDQYTPDNFVLRNPDKWKDIARRPYPEEISEALEYAKELGLYTEV
ncbi:MAG: radical SAM protein [Desulfurococcales archaeon]|nr:radical SAM protein [Desulfurococcales archaeon]